jgi:hypothetical protein
MTTLVYGPQTDRIETLLAAVREMTPAAWAAAWAAVGAAERDAAWVAVWAAERDAERVAEWRDAVWSVTRDAMRPAAMPVAHDPAAALVVLDLVGQYGLTREHVDTLAAPILTVMPGLGYLFEAVDIGPSVTDVVIFDIDGTLCDTRSIVHHVTGEKKDFDAFHAASADCPPNAHVVDMYRREVASGTPVVIVTGRGAQWWQMTSEWLDRHGIDHIGIFMRPEGDYRPDTVVKSEILDLVVSRGYRVVRAYDDRPSVLAMWRERGISAVDVGTWRGDTS